jgi:glucose-6-phosphate 1-dehydrogenase
MNFDDDQGYVGLKKMLEQYDRDYSTRGNRLFYLATAPEYFADIVHRLGEQGMAKPEVGIARTIIEKPFGHDLESAKELNDDVNTVFSENQIFRIDHYLGKETVQNVLVFRFANGIFEPIWNRNFIDHVQITAAESIGIEGRGPFYEKAGALRDVVQNHMMELLSFVTMEPPASFASEAVRAEKIKLWSSIKPLNIFDCVRGQYGPGIVGDQMVKGYREEDRVDPKSQTETYAAVRLEIDVTIWRAYAWAVRRFSAQHHHHAHSAGRRHLTAVWREGAGSADGGMPGDYGLQLCAGFWRIVGQRIRTPAARRDAGRRHAVRASRRC